MRDLRKSIARGICTFGATINRNRDGYGSIQAADPTEPCLETCDYCWHMANHILNNVEEYTDDEQQPIKGACRADREA